jgi:hypothetical protein
VEISVVRLCATPSSSMELLLEDIVEGLWPLATSSELRELHTYRLCVPDAGAFGNRGWIQA